MPEISPSKYVVRAGWDDVPHLNEDAKRELRASIPPHLLDARSKGIPSLGAGAIYPIPMAQIEVAPFAIPPYWPRAFALDVGWNKTAALWGAVDRNEDIVYAYAEHYMGEEQPLVHAQAIKARGAWIPGVIDPAARGRSQRDGERLRDAYIDLGLNLTDADNGVESGIYEVWERLSTGRLKIFTSLVNLRFEYDIYRRDEKGKVVKKFDHLMDDLRYLIVSGLKVAIPKPVVHPIGTQVVSYGVRGSGY